MEPIRVEDILRPTDNLVPIIGKVQQIWGPKRIAIESEFECGFCGYICNVQAKFPYETNYNPKKCNSCYTNRLLTLKAPSSEFLTWNKIHLRARSTSFILEYIGEQKQPKIGDTICFESPIFAKIKNNNPVISIWTGETTSFDILE